MHMASAGDEPLLPPEIIINIFKRLPVKSIIRFRSVCKDWKNLFKTPYFITEHSRHSGHENPLLLLIVYNCYDKGTPLFLRLVNHKMETVEALSIPSFDFLNNDWKIVGSCNGLLLVEDDDVLNRFPHSLFLWNPMIREVRKLHPTKKKDYFRSCKHGLGFSSIVNDYKIVKFYNQELRKKKKKQNYDATHNGHNGAEVFSLTTSSWKELEFGALQNITIKSTAVSTNGSILWLGVCDSCHVVVSFDISTEEFTLTPLTIHFKDEFPPNRTTLGLYKNKLYVFECDNSGGSFSSIISWVMEEVASESGKRFSCTKVYDFGYNPWSFKPLCIWRNEIVFQDDEFEEDFELDEDYELKLFNATTKKWKEFSNFSYDTDECEGCNYERSLMSVWNSQVI